jgi:hypothetical protein
VYKSYNLFKKEYIWREDDLVCVRKNADGTMMYYGLYGRYWEVWDQGYIPEILKDLGGIDRINSLEIIDFLTVNLIILKVLAALNI